MAKAINIDPPLSTPTITLSILSGTGNFAAGTYTIGIYMSGSVSEGPYSMWNSACIEDSITVSANDGIRITYGSIDSDATRVYIYRKTATSYDDLGTHTGYVYTSGAPLSTYPTYFDLTAPSWGDRLGCLNIYESDKFFFGLNPHNGIGRINVISDEDVTISEIIDAVTGSSMVSGDDYIAILNPVATNSTNSSTLLCNYSLRLTDSSDCTVDCTGGIMYFAGGIESITSTVEFNASSSRLTTVIFSSKRGGWGQSNNISNITAKYCTFSWIQTYYSDGGFTYGYSGGGDNNFGTGTLEASFLHQYYGGFQSVQENCLLINSGNLNLNLNEQPITQKNVINRIQTYSSSDKYFSNQEFICGYTSSDVLFTANGTFDVYFLNCKFDSAKQGIITYVPFHYVLTYGVGKDPYHYYGILFNMNVVDTNGDGIDTVNVKCYDKNSTLVFNVDTDVDGKITEQDLYFCSFQVIGSGTTGNETSENSIKTYLYPYTIEISKSGYNDYSFIIPEVDSPMNTIVKYTPGILPDKPEFKFITHKKITGV